MVEKLSKMETKVLRSIKDSKSIEKAAKELGAQAATLGGLIARLQIKGYLSEDGSVTPKGIDALARDSG